MPPRQFKAVLLGDSDVGKTSVIRRWFPRSGVDSPGPTVASAVASGSVDIDGDSHRLTVVDTAGQERYRSLIPSCLRGAHVAIIVFDVTHAASFAAVPGWVEVVREVVNPTIVLIGNKVDLTDKRCVSLFRAMKFAQEKEFDYFETSASTGYGTEAALRAVCMAAIAREELVAQLEADRSEVPADNEKSDCC
jgi:Ras-related protein Rab-6A